MLLAVLGANLMLKCFAFLQNSLAHRLSEDRGATAVEYGLLVALIATAIVAVVTTLGTTVAAWFGTVRAGF